MGPHRPFQKDARLRCHGGISSMICTLTKDIVQSAPYDNGSAVSLKSRTVHMDSRSALDSTKKCPRMAKALRQLQHNIVPDGEVVVRKFVHVRSQ
jgi:bifunctional non-homologous end joining protein LigD